MFFHVTIPQMILKTANVMLQLGQMVLGMGVAGCESAKWI